jgi:RNA polymerase sigma-70 factor (ECF subfamily)
MSAHSAPPLVIAHPFPESPDELETDEPRRPTPTAEEVFLAYGSRVYSVALRMLGNTADAEDVAQDVLVQVILNLDGFRGEAELSTWLHRVTVNAVLQYRRKHAPRLARQVQVAPEYVLDATQSPGGRRAPLVRPEQIIMDREAREMFERAIIALPESYRDVFVLSDVEGMANAEIGQLLGLSLPAVKSRLHRARLQLRDALAPYFGEGEAE